MLVLFQLFVILCAVALTWLCASCILQKCGRGESGPVRLTQRLLGAPSNDKDNGLAEKLYRWAEEHVLVLFLAILAVFAISRIYKLGEVPRGMHCDELGMAYDAWSLSFEHVDRYQKKMPVYFINFGGGQNAMYTYLAGALMLFLDYSPLVVRIPAVVMGFVTLLFNFLLAGELLHSRRAALLSAYLVTVCPWFVMAQRWGLESLLMIGFFTAAIYFFLMAVKKDRIWLYLAAGFVFGLTLYTYAISYIAVPLFLLFSLIYLKRVGKLRFGRWCLMGIPLFCLALPLLTMLFINHFELPEIATRYFTIPRLPMYRGDDINLSTLWHNFHIFWTMLSYDKNPVLIYNALPPFGTLYYFSVPLVLYGFGICAAGAVKSFRKKEADYGAFMLFLFLSVMLTNLFVNDTNLNKINAVFTAAVFFIVLAVREISRNYRQAVPAVLLMYAVGFLAFTGFYFNRYDDAYEQELVDDLVFTETMEYFNEHYYDAQDTIYVDDDGVLSGDLQLLLLLRASAFDWDRRNQLIRNYHFAYPGEMDEEAGNKTGLDPGGVYIVNMEENPGLAAQLTEMGLNCFDTYKQYNFYK